MDERLELRDRIVDLWYTDLQAPAEVVEALRPLLSPDELERAGRFRFEKHQRRYVVRRGRLRILLGRYLGQPPAAIEIVYGERGKPALASELTRPPAERLELNLSDSEDLTVYAVARGLEIGVDVEMVRPMIDALSISESFFSDDERQVLAAVPEDQISETFFNCWTRKEAYLKAIGEGLAEPLDSFSVTLRPGDPARFLSFKKVPHELGSWSLFHLRPTPDSIAALALRDRGWSFEERGFMEHQGLGSPQ